MTQPGLPRRPPILLLGAAAVLLVVVLVLLPNAGSDRGRTTTTVDPVGLSERAPFGKPLDGYLAYLTTDRTFVLVDLRTGRVRGSKGIPGDRRAAAASNTAAFLGNLPQGSEDDGNWDSFRSLAWEGTASSDHGDGMGIVYSPRLNAIAKAMRPLPEDAGNGVRIVGETEAWNATASDGFWSLPVWMGDRVLARELTGDEVRWWLIDGRAPGTPEEVDLPDEFLPIAGTDGLVMGQLGEEGVIVDLTDGTVSRLTGRWSWAAQWRPLGDPILATVGGDPPTLIGYLPNGLFDWSVPLTEGATRFGGGVAWAPDGSFVVAPARGTIEAVTSTGGSIGALDPSLPDPQATDDSGFVTVVPRPP